LNFIFSNKFAFSNNTKQLAAKIEKRIRTKKMRNQPNWAGPKPTAQQTSPGRRPRSSFPLSHRYVVPTCHLLPLTASLFF
jgi:hypothetical protein